MKNLFVLFEYFHYFEMRARVKNEPAKMKNTIHTQIGSLQKQIESLLRNSAFKLDVDIRETGFEVIILKK